MTLNRDDAGLVRPFLLLVVYDSMVAAHVNTFLGETFTAMGLVVGLIAVSTASRLPVRLVGWVLVVLAAVNSPATIPAVGLAVLLLAVRTRRYHCLLTLPVILALALVDTRLHTGSFSSPHPNDKGFVTILPYSGRPNFSYPALLGVLVILVSFGKGLVFFTPGAFLAVKGRLAGFGRTATAYPLWVAVSLGLVAAYCRWWAWYGGFTWGPRFFLFVSILACMALAIRLMTPANSLAGALVTLGALALTT